MEQAMRKLLALLLFVALPALAQQQINLTSQVRGILPIANGGTNASSASGTAVDNISGFASTGFLTRTGAGAYSFQSTTNGITLGNVAQIGTNTVLGNFTSGTANVSALSVGGCSSASSALIWTTNTGFGCNTSITAAAVPVSGITGLGTGIATALGVNVGTAGAPVVNGGALGTPSGGTVTNLTGTASININGTVGATTPTTGAFTSVNASGNVTAGGSVTISRNAGTGKVSISDSIVEPYTAGINFNTYEDGSSGPAYQFQNGAGGTTYLSIGGNVNGIAVPGFSTSSAATTGSMCWTTGTGVITVDTTTTCLLSSEKYKKDEKALTGGLRRVLALRPIAYTLRSQYNPTGLGEQIGFLAEDVAKVDPRLVSLDDVDGTPHAVRYQQLTAVLAKAIQEQQRQINKLRRRIAKLEGR